MSTLRPVAAADRVVAETVAELRPGLRKTSPSLVPTASSLSALTDVEKCNIRSKEAFDVAIEGAGMGEDSVRALALFFGVKKSTLHERMSRRRTDLAPLPEWFQKLADFAEFNRLAAVFLRQA